MKLHFEDNLDYQLRAIESVVGLFKGQEISRSEFTVTWQAESDPQSSLGMMENQPGVGNKLQLIDEDIYDNLKSVQLGNGLVPSETLASGDFTVEMETGTGKTYVYLRTMFELHQEYGFTKFVIVVPSVAIKEGTYKTLEITREHFEALYPKAMGYEYFLYDSSRPGQVRNFATSSNIPEETGRYGVTDCQNFRLHGCCRATGESRSKGIKKPGESRAFYSRKEDAREL